MHDSEKNVFSELLKSEYVFAVFYSFLVISNKFEYIFRIESKYR